MVKSGLFTVSPEEADLIEAIDLVGYGELYSVDVPAGGGEFIECELPKATQDLILYIRSGFPHIDILTVHHGQPAFAEFDGEIRGFRCRKKVKFPTG